MKMKSYIAWSRDKKILESSSSGGVFQTIANVFLSKYCGSSIFGAWQDNSQIVVMHREVKTQDDIYLLAGSKYYQSELHTTYHDIKDKLKKQQKVLFSGTPCQVAGLKAYLKGDGLASDTNLVTIEVLCHGVSSRKVILHYVDWRTTKFGKKIIDLRFRTKKRRWYDRGSSMEIYYDDESNQVIDRHFDPFYLAYNNNLCLRPSCYSCRFAKIERVADITIGDFWGAEQFVNDRKRLNDGISLVLINSENGKLIWELASNNIYSEEIDINKAIPRNGAIIKSVKEPLLRKKFFDDLENKNFDELVKSCLGRKKVLSNRIKGLVGETNIANVKRLLKTINKKFRY